MRKRSHDALQFLSVMDILLLVPTAKHSNR